MTGLLDELRAKLEAQERRQNPTVKAVKERGRSRSGGTPGMKVPGQKLTPEVKEARTARQREVSASLHLPAMLVPVHARSRGKIGAARLTIPTYVQEQVGWVAGVMINFEPQEDGTVLLRRAEET